MSSLHGALPAAHRAPPAPGGSPPPTLAFWGNKKPCSPGEESSVPPGFVWDGCHHQQAQIGAEKLGGDVPGQAGERGDVAQPRADTGTLSWGSGNASEELMSADTKSCGCLCKQGTAARRKDQSWDIHPKPQTSTPGWRKAPVLAPGCPLPSSGTQGRLSRLSHPPALVVTEVAAVPELPAGTGGTEAPASARGGIASRGVTKEGTARGDRVRQAVSNRSSGERRQRADRAATLPPMQPVLRKDCSVFSRLPPSGEAVRSSGSSAPALPAKGTGYLCPYWHLPLLLFLFSILSSSACAGCGISGSSPPGGKQPLALCREHAFHA